MATRSPSEPTELLPVEPLRDFLDAAGIGSGDLEVEAIAGGHSNLTFSVRRGEQAWVLRRPPRPPYPPSAHDVIREAELLRQLGTHTPVPVPEILVTCRNEAVIGVPFVVMSFVPGVVLADVAPTWAREESAAGSPLPSWTRSPKFTGWTGAPPGSRTSAGRADTSNASSVASRCSGRSTRRVRFQTWTSS